MKEALERAQALLGLILREADTPVWPAQRWATSTFALSRALVLERVCLSSWVLQEAKASTFRGSAFPPHSRQRPGSPV